jgi:Ca-activated chloride channel family protein
MALSPRQRWWGLVLGMALTPAAWADFADWWLTPDQRGRLAYEKGDYARAAQRFQDPLWKALALYASGDFASAGGYFAQIGTAVGRFYLGNALAHQGQLRPAMTAYQAALVLDPELDAARLNLDWVGGLAALEEAEYEDAGGTGGKLAADDFVFSNRAKDASSEMTADEAKAQGLTDAQIEEIWMRRVQTTPAEFLASKFAQQLNQRQAEP